MSPWHWAVVIGVALLLFGAKRLPDAARSLGRSARILRAELHAPAPDEPVAAPDKVEHPVAQAPIDTPAPVAAPQPQG